MIIYDRASTGIRGAFVLVEIVLGLMVLGVVLILSAKILFYIQEDNIKHSRALSLELQMNNTLDALEAYLLEASKNSISYGKNFMSWDSDFLDSKPSLKDTLGSSLKTSHTLTLNQNSLYFDGFLMLDGVDEFEIMRMDNIFKIRLCTKPKKKTLCRYKFIRLLYF
ncbi:hypothetical protein [Helicobacter cappadocius]|uniref:Uncharacterized protein n=1 Tax=Helicobacter cappadocius TaxID=3063998 RepID=A0AA90PPI9_9HELI|nr:MULTISPECIES: hypothetical protein [unclassified Helicobacter]MDO7252419.1 hypothetical protein [Helicobacter sp. faydin-H75]MDP2538286.1 hypothetical protein [Helicobacter sp. faydin-H76]